MIVAGAGLAGLGAARDLMNQGTDVIVLEARNRAGGRIVELGGEVVGPFHRAYVQLVEELGLTIVPSFPQLPGEDTWVLADGRHVGAGLPDRARRRCWDLRKISTCTRRFLPCAERPRVAIVACASS